MGDVIGDLSSRRGKVLGSDSQGGLTELKVYVPMSEVLRYAPDLRSMTGGQGTSPWNSTTTKKLPSPWWTRSWPLTKPPRLLNK